MHKYITVNRRGYQVMFLSYNLSLPYAGESTFWCSNSWCAQLKKIKGYVDPSWCRGQILVTII